MSPTPHSALSVPSFDNTLGVLLIGEIATAVLFGVTSIQTYTYFGRCQRDGALMKSAISLLWVTDVVHLALTSHAVYHYTVTNFMNPLELFNIPWSLSANMIVGDFGEAIIYSIFLHRACKLSGNLWPIVLFAPPALFGFIGAIGIAVLALEFPIFMVFRAKFAWLYYATFSTQTLCDCAIAVSICTVLIKQRTGFKKTDSLIRTLIMYTVSTGILSSTVAIVSVLTFALMPHNFVFIPFAMVLPKLMLNSLLALLNSRESMRGRTDGPISIHLSKLKAEPEATLEEARKREDDQVVDICQKAFDSSRETLPVNAQHSQA